jgi:tetratricopeptide (TPR) repeat protein
VTDRREAGVELGMDCGSGATGADESGTAALVRRAEVARAAGDPELALRLAREALRDDPDAVAAHAAAALALLDLERIDEAQRLLESLTGVDRDAVAAPLGVLDDSELDRALADASTDAADMRDANDVAYEAMRSAALDAPELSDPGVPGSPFHTHTMAALLERRARRGARAGAPAIRSALATARPHEDDPPAGDRRAEVIRTLERWLERLHRGDA